MPAPSPERVQIGAALARAVRDGRPERVVTDLRRDFTAAKLAEHIERVVAEAPPLKPEQIDRLAALLRGGRPA